MDNVFILGAADPEMNAIENLLALYDIRFEYAQADGKRVHPGNAYQADQVILEVGETAVLVECQPKAVTFEDGFPAEVIRIDHHRPGDPGYGRKPAEYWEASSIGQVFRFLELAPSREAKVIAAADHCLTAAYAGQCPGIDPDGLMEWRMRSRAAFQERPVEWVLVDVRAAMEQIRTAPIIYLMPCTGGIDDHEHQIYCGCPDGMGFHPVTDLRGPAIDELPEAAARMGRAIMAGPLPCPDGRKKIVLQSADPPTIKAWLAGGGPADVIDRYGDPERGFAGGYLK